MSVRVKKEPQVGAAAVAASSSQSEAAEEDEVVARIPLRLVKPSQRLLYLLQHPLRPSNRPYEDAGELTTVQHKQKFDMLQMKYQVSASTGAHLPPSQQESLTLNSSLVRPQAQLLAGRMIQGELWVRPFRAVLRMRPGFEHLEPSLDGDEEAMAEADKASVARAITVKFQKEDTEKSVANRHRSHVFLQQQVAACPWTELKVNEDDAELSDDDVEMDGSSSSSSSSSSSNPELDLELELLDDVGRREAARLVQSLRDAAAAEAFDQDDELGGCERLPAAEYLRRVVGGGDQLDQEHPPEFQNHGASRPPGNAPSEPPPTHTSPSGQRFSLAIAESLSPERRNLVMDDAVRMRPAHDAIRGRILGALVGAQVISTRQLYERVGAVAEPQRKLTLRLVEGLGHLVQGLWVCPSDYMFPNRPRLYFCREWLLQQFQQASRIPARQILLAGRLTVAELLEITERLCRPVVVDGEPMWELALPMDFVFQQDNPELVESKRLELAWMRKRLQEVWGSLDGPRPEQIGIQPPEDPRFKSLPPEAHIDTRSRRGFAAGSSVAAAAASSSSSAAAAAGPAPLSGSGAVEMDLSMSGPGFLAPPKPSSKPGGSKFAPRAGRSRRPASRDS